VTVLNVKMARAIWLVESRDLNPRGIDIWPLLGQIKARYNFQTFPKSVAEADETTTTGIVFANGSFTSGSGRYTISKATIFGDGIVVDSALSTDFCEEFIRDALTFLATQFGLTYAPTMVHKKMYVSELIVHTDKDILGKLFGPLRAFAESLSKAYGVKLDPYSLALSGDQALPTKVGFKFEREAGKAFSQNRYYTSAALPTTVHESFLNDLESSLS
jgi:hypothetical protein